MNWHKITTTGAGVLAAGGLLASAGHSFVQLNTPDAGILTSAGASGILLPAVLAGPVAWLVSWITHFLLSAGLPAAPNKPPVATPNSTEQSPVIAPADGPAMLKDFATLDLRALSSRLGQAGRYEEVAIVAKVARDWGDK